MKIDSVISSNTLNNFQLIQYKIQHDVLILNLPPPPKKKLFFYIIYFVLQKINDYLQSGDHFEWKNLIKTMLHGEYGN